MVAALDATGLARVLVDTPAAPVYVVTGACGWFRDQALKALRRAVLGPEPDSLAETRGALGETELSSLLDAARTRPMLAGRRLVLIGQAEALDSAGVALLVEYAARPAEFTCLVLHGESLPAAARALSAGVVAVSCAPLRPWDVPRWIEERLRSARLNAGPGAAEALHDLLGDDPAVLAAAIDRLGLLAGRAPLTATTIREMLDPVAHGTVWEFIEALEDRRTEAALRGLDALLEQGETPESILRLIVRSRRQLLGGIEARRDGAGEDHVLSAAGMSPKARVVPRLRRAVLSRLASHSRAELLLAFARLLEADSRLKGGGGEAAGVLLGRLVLDLLRPQARAAAGAP